MSVVASKEASNDMDSTSRGETENDSHDAAAGGKDDNNHIATKQ